MIPITGMRAAANADFMGGSFRELPDTEEEA